MPLKRKEGPTIWEVCCFLTKSWENNLFGYPIENGNLNWSIVCERNMASRIDRFSWAEGWSRAFPDIPLGLVSRVVSDHYPLILEYANKWGPIPFRFKNMWLEHHEFGGENLRKVGTWERFKLTSRLKHIKPK